MLLSWGPGVRGRVLPAPWIRLKSPFSHLILVVQLSEDLVVPLDLLQVGEFFLLLLLQIDAHLLPETFHYQAEIDEREHLSVETRVRLARSESWEGGMEGRTDR